MPDEIENKRVRPRSYTLPMHRCPLCGSRHIVMKPRKSKPETVGA